MIHIRDFTTFEKSNMAFLVDKQIKFATMEITETGYKKSILDSTGPVRTYFYEAGIHDYSTQIQGPDNKKLVKTFILTDEEQIESKSSLYRPITKDGDPRMWIYKLNKYIQAFDIFAIIAKEGTLYVINLTRIDIRRAYANIYSPLRVLIDSI